MTEENEFFTKVDQVPVYLPDPVVKRLEEMITSEFLSKEHLITYLILQFMEEPLRKIKEETEDERMEHFVHFQVEKKSIEWIAEKYDTSEQQVKLSCIELSEILDLELREP